MLSGGGGGDGNDTVYIMKLVELHCLFGKSGRNEETIDGLVVDTRGQISMIFQLCL